MANSVAELNVYNHYLTTYMPKGTSTYDTHKKSELRGVYNSIVKMNKESPLYLLKNVDDSKAYAIGLKEGARELGNTISSLGGMDEESLLAGKTAYSDNEDIAEVNYVGNLKAGDSAPSMELSVQAMATPQVNEGAFLPAEEEAPLEPDTYSFDLNINDLNYEFQFQVREGDTNEELQSRLTRLINSSNIGLKAETVEDGEGNTSLTLTSEKTGKLHGNDTLFTISDYKTSKTAGVVDYLGIGRVAEKPQNAEFTINGVNHTATSNLFTVEKMYEIELTGVSADQSDVTHIGLHNDAESLLQNMRKLVGGYNNFLQTAQQYTNNFPRSSQLVREMSAITGRYQESLSDMGMSVSGDGTIDMDEEKIKDSAFSAGGADKLSQIKNFAKDVFKKTKQIGLNPMNYVDKTIVAYKNPKRLLASTYTTSAYSGMLFNSYC